MNSVPKKKKNKQKNKKSLNKVQYKPTTNQFWLNMASKNYIIPTNINMNFEKISSGMTQTFGSKQQLESLQELTDDNSPSVPFANSSAQNLQGLIHITKKPKLNIQERIQNKIKVEMVKHEQDVSQSQMNNEERNMEKNDAQNSKHNLQQNVKIEKEQFGNEPDKIPPISEIDKRKQTEYFEKTKIIEQEATQIPVITTWNRLAKVGKQNNLQSTEMSNNNNNNKGERIPVLNWEPIVPQQSMGIAMGFQASGQFLPPVEQHFYENVYRITDPNIIRINNDTAQEPMVPEPIGMEPSCHNMHAYQDPVYASEMCEVSTFPELCLPEQKRLSAFERLGPYTESKNPELTINLNLDRKEPVREVVDEREETTDTFVPVHEQEVIVNSSDIIVKKYLSHWPWNKEVHVKRTICASTFEMMEQKQMKMIYKCDNKFIGITVKGYPKTWSKEDVLDTLLDKLHGTGFIPCFIEFSPRECKFLVIKCYMALLEIHKLGFCIYKDDVILKIKISVINLTLNHIYFVPGLILRRRMFMGLENKKKLSLKAFTLQPDISHFIYFPLNYSKHQIEIEQCFFDWKNLVELDLSNNRLKSLENFNLPQKTPHLVSLDVSNNYIEKITALLHCRNLPLKSLKLEGNPLCTDYTDPDHYIRVTKMLFPMLKELDGIPITPKGEIPLVRKNFCLPDAAPVVEKFLETFIPIMDSPPHERVVIEEMYDDDAILTITYRQRLRLTSVYEKFNSLFPSHLYQRRSAKDSLKSPRNIVKLFIKWPDLLHDPTSFTVDVLWHSDSTTILRVGGVVKVTSSTLSVDEHILAFSRTVLLHTTNGFEYKIRNEMLYWDLPTEEFTKNAFRITIPQKTLNVALESPADKISQEKFIRIFMKLTELDRTSSVRCLEEQGWNLKDALSFFTNLMKNIHKGDINLEVALMETMKDVNRASTEEDAKKR